MRSAKISLWILLGPGIALGQSADENAAEYTGDSAQRGIACWVNFPQAGFDPNALEESIELTSGNADIDATGDASFTGPIEIRSPARSIKANSASYDADTTTFDAAGDILYRDTFSIVSGDTARFNTTTRELAFSGSSFQLGEVPARGFAEQIDISGAGIIDLENVGYTSCPEGNNDWMLKAGSIRLDNEAGRAVAKHARLSFKGVPFFYWPYFTYPISDERKSGLLFPKIGSSDRRGFEISQPIYWNIRPNMDATFVPRYMSDRGLQLGGQYRYLTRSNQGVLWGDYLDSDKETDESRWRYELDTVSMLPKAWRAGIDMTGVSDDNYYEDMSASVAQTSQVVLRRAGELEYYDSVWSIYMQVQDYQTIDPLIAPVDEAYFQVPQIVVNGLWRDGPLGLEYGFDSEATYFHKDDEVSGARVHVLPKVALPFRSRGVYLVPEVGFDYTAYKLQDEAVGQSDSPDRAAPIVSVDTGAIFERSLGENRKRIITIEPRAKYSYIPFRDQSEIPVFDTIVTDFNLVQLFRENRFVGYDRLGDTNQVSLGLTSRVLDNETGRQLLTATIGQARFFNDGEVTLPGEIPSEVRQSSYIAELGVNVWGNWNADAFYQLDSDARETERGSVRFQYKPGDNKAINLGYRYVRDSVDQTDFSFAWPISDSWSAIGRYNYSIADKEVLDEYLGVEYSSCCWGVRLVGRRSVARSTGEPDTSVSFQFVLKGFSGLGSEATETLRRDILGFTQN